MSPATDTKGVPSWGRVARAGTAGTLVMWVIAYTWHNLLLSGFYVRNLFPGNAFDPEEVSTTLLLVGYVILGYSMAYVAARMPMRGHPVAAGLRFGLLIGILGVAPMTVMVYAVGELTTLGLIVDLSWHVLVEEPLGGCAIAVALARWP